MTTQGRIKTTRVALSRWRNNGGTWTLLETVSRAAQNAPAGRVFDTLVQGLISNLCGMTKNALNVKRSVVHNRYSNHVLAQAKSTWL